MYVLHVRIYDACMSVWYVLYIYMYVCMYVCIATVSVSAVSDLRDSDARVY